MMDIASYLAERYAEEQADAEIAEYGFMYFDTDDPDVTKHYQRWDGARVLAELAAKRAILAMHKPQVDLRIRDGLYVEDPPKCTICFMPYPKRGNYELWPCPTVRGLAAPYASRPDFKADWRLDA